MHKIIAMCTPQITEFSVIALGLKERGNGVPTYTLQSYGKKYIIYCLAKIFLIPVSSQISKA